MSPSRRDFAQLMIGAGLGGLLASGCRSSSSANAAEPQGQFLEDTPYMLIPSPRGINVWYPRWLFAHPQFGPGNFEALMGKEVDETPNQFSDKTIHDLPDPQGVTVVVGPISGFYVSQGPLAAGVYKVTQRVIVCAYKSHSEVIKNDSGRILPSYAHELAHAFGWAGSHPDTCPTCMTGIDL